MVKSGDTNEVNVGSDNEGSVSAASDDLLPANKCPKASDDDRNSVVEIKAQDSQDEEEKEEEKIPTVNYFKLFRFADKWDVIMLVIALLSSAGHGSMMALFATIFGDVFDSYDPFNPTQSLESAFMPAVEKFLYFGAIAFVTSYAQVGFTMLSASRQARRMRNLYFKSIISQDMAWFDAVDSGELTARVAGDVVKIESAIGDKVGNFVQYMSMCIAGFIIGFIYGWKLTLVIVATTPILAGGGAMMAKLMADAVTEGQAAYAKAGGVAEEVFGMIRVVTAFTGQQDELKRYAVALEKAYETGRKKGIWSGLGMAFTMGFMILTYALGFWYGNKLVADGEMKVGDVTTVFFSVVMGAFALGQAAPSITAFAEGCGTAHYIFSVIDRTPDINNLSTEGEIPTECKGNISFENVVFNYVSRPDQKVLNKMNFDLQGGNTLALVGHSGCGKSTCIQLLERYYDVVSGAIRLDGRDIRDLNIQWLRSQIGIVSQMPTLFAMTIGENIAAGAAIEEMPNWVENGSVGERFRRMAVTQEDIVKAAKEANAHNFITKLPEGYDTMVGGRGAQLSGGQKQRIAIARALIRNPSVMLLDEATSALDSESERIVQEALEKASVGRSTIVIAHRLSTVQNADTIAVVENGNIVEAGTHEELLAQRGAYADFVALQTMKEEVPEDEQMIDDMYHEATDPMASQSQRNSVLSAAEDEKHHSMKRVSTKKSVLSQQREKFLTKKKASEEDVDKSVDDGVIVRAFKFNKDEWRLITLGLIGALGMGLVWPAFSFIFSKIITVMIEGDQSDVDFYSLMFVALAAFVFIAQWLAISPLAMSGELLTQKVRLASFKAIMRQDIGFFDARENSVGVLSARLSTEAADVQSVTGVRLGNLTTVVSTMAFGLGIAFTSCPILAAVVLACVPAVAVGGMLQMQMMTGFQKDGNVMFEKAGSIASETVDSIRTVLAINAADEQLSKYAVELMAPYKATVKSAHIAGIGFGFSEFCMFGIWAISFWFGSTLVDDEKCSFDEMLIAINAIVFGAMTLGQVSAMMPDAGKAQISATKVFRLLDRVPQIDSEDPSGANITDSKGEFEFKDIRFSYPTRREVTVLTKLCVSVKPGQTLALVGESGCGKSTLIALAERFYKAIDGSIMLDGKNIEDINILSLRDQIGLVNQEPDLFKTSVRNNIAYGRMKCSDVPVTQEMIEEAAKKANAHDFIMNLPEGYDTDVGERGSQLSGGQRQRVAIARALVRNPKILLLDEATSALDSQSEKLVQVALDEAAKGRTTISIAHRLSTIQNADCIAFVKDGVIVESGTHNKLMNLDGHYAQLVRTQMRQE
eukprot:CFRG3938T1